tara:strand:- start:2 stop:208 length:207 start_codon:yes stop_codon:yes gene_type:complete
MFKRPPFKFEKGDVVKIKDSGIIGIVVKSEWMDYYTEGRPIKIVETERVHLSSNRGIDMIHASDIELV